MRKLKLQMQLSIDGFVAASKPGVHWQVWDFSPEWTWGPRLQKYHTDMTASIDTVLLSRKMAEEGFIDYWAGIATQTKNPERHFAANVTKARKVIFSKTLKTTRWENSEIAQGNLVKAVNDLKAQKGKDLIVYGGVEFVSNLIKENLIDEYHLVINPVILGKGLSVFDKIKEAMNLSLVEATTYEDGMSVLVYAVR